MSPLPLRRRRSGCGRPTAWQAHSITWCVSFMAKDDICHHRAKYCDMAGTVASRMTTTTCESKPDAFATGPHNDSQRPGTIRASHWHLRHLPRPRYAAPVASESHFVKSIVQVFCCLHVQLVTLITQLSPATSSARYQTSARHRVDRSQIGSKSPPSQQSVRLECRPL